MRWLGARDQWSEEQSGVDDEGDERKHESASRRGIHGGEDRGIGSAAARGEQK